MVENTDLMPESITEQFSDNVLPSSHIQATEGMTDDMLRTLDPMGLSPLVNEYTLTLANMERELLIATSKLLPQEADVVDAIMNYRTITDRLKTLGISRTAYNKLADSPAVKKTLTIMAAYSITQSGGTRAARKLQLHQISLQTQLSKPQVCINAIAEITAMENAERAFVMAKEQQSSANGSGGVIFQFDIG